MVVLFNLKDEIKYFYLVLDLLQYLRNNVNIIINKQIKRYEIIT